jgi:NAD(P)-dependent dehydrogenase (short-subunit alcohol dehydrogenase family)
VTGRLQGSQALVTGASRGIGWAIARSLAAEGAAVTLVARDAALLAERAASLIAEFGVPAGFEAIDVTDEAAVTGAFERAAALRGPVTILVNNAGRGTSKPFAKMDLAHWNEMVAINLTSAYLCARAAVPGMLAAGQGRIVNVASTAGLTGYGYVVAYCAAKHGVIGLTRGLARELARKNITVNAVCPGYVDTEMTGATIANIVEKTGRSPEQAMAELTKDNPQGRLVQPDEVAAAVRVLCLPDAGAVTGQAIPVDGGEVAK